jgi:predicted amidohydrolase YtcJ
MSLAASTSSVPCGPPTVTAWDELATAIACVEGDGWIRGVGYHESVAGALDRAALDILAPHRPLRIQHRSGRMWMVNSKALAELGLPLSKGRLVGADPEIRRRLAKVAPPDLSPLATMLAGFGVTGVTDATPGLTSTDAARLSASLPQRVVAMGHGAAPAKIMLHETELPTLDVLTAQISTIHGSGRGVAVHCVTLATLVFALSAIDGAGHLRGDRIEHAAVATPEAVDWIGRLGLTVVTQPSLAAERRAEHEAEVDRADLPWLWGAGRFVAAGVPLGGGTDAPFGAADPWLAMRSAVERRGEDALTPEQALALFTSDPAEPGGAARRVEVGAPADLCLLTMPWARARSSLEASLVRAVVVGGAPVLSPGS